MWSPDGKVLLAAFDQTTSLAALHFAGKPPSLGIIPLLSSHFTGAMIRWLLVMLILALM